jgi:DNA-binding response OmpR family regulator
VSSSVPQPSTGTATQPEAGAIADDRDPLDAGTILIVDDDRVTRTVVASILNMESYHVIEAQDGKEALDKAKQSKPGLMVLDVNMPRLDGFTVCRELRADPELAGMRVLILSGRGKRADAELARQMGADAYLTKPFSSVGLVEVVRQLAGE